MHECMLVSWWEELPRVGINHQECGFCTALHCTTFRLLEATCVLVSCFRLINCTLSTSVNKLAIEAVGLMKDVLNIMLKCETGYMSFIVIWRVMDTVIVPEGITCLHSML